tara:strand:+ start:628 stop:1092 length:465 start_codon:yes stop_codon:yes gene_type:complete
MPNQPRNKFGRQARMQRRNATSTSKQSPGVERKVDASADRVDIVLPAVNVTAKGPRYADVRAGRTTAAQESKFRYRKAQEAKAAKAAKKPSVIKPVVAPKPKLKTFTSSDLIGTEGMSAGEIVKRGPQGEPKRRRNESITAFRQRLAKYRRENK